MISEATIVSRFEALIERANKLIQEKHRSTYDRIDLVDSAQYQGWRAQALTALVDLVSEAHPYTKAFESAARDTEVSYVESAKQVLVSLLDDLKKGYLQSLSNLISAEVFSDFLEMARHLLDNGYKDPAAMLIGAVLEDGLKRIANARQVSLGGREGISDVNAALARGNVYNNLKRDQIAVWIRIRNGADHAQFSDYTNSDVESMHSGVVQFLADHLS